MNANKMQIDQAGVDFIKEFEGLRLKAYQDFVGVWTIGYGSTEGVKPGMTITEAEAEALLRTDIAKHEQPVRDCVDVELSQAEYNALVSFTFNLGGGAFRASTLLKELNAGDRPEAAYNFCRWRKAGGGTSAGLLRRRMAEASLFLFG